MREKITVAIILLVLLLAGWLFFTRTSDNPPEQSAATESQKTAAAKDGDDTRVVLGVFEGTVPCADCEGIKMTLTLYQDPATLGATGYTLDSVYLGRENSDYNEQGEWDYLRGNDTDLDATIYGLNLDKPKEDQQYFLKVGDNEIKMLDMDMNVINSNLNYTLTRQTND